MSVDQVAPVISDRQRRNTLLEELLKDYPVDKEEIKHDLVVWAALLGAILKDSDLSPSGSPLLHQPGDGEPIFIINHR